MTITEALNELRAEAARLHIDLEGDDDEDLIVRALGILTSQLEMEFNEIEDEFNYNDFHELKPGDEGYVAG